MKTQNVTLLEQWHQASQRLLTDSKLGSLVSKVGPVNIEFESDAFSALGKAILSQQLAPKAAESIIGRVCAESGKFPSSKVLQNWPEETFRKNGVSKQKRRYLISLAEKWVDTEWRSDWSMLSDEALIKRLVEVKGIGVWTAQMYLIFSCGRLDVLALDDYGLKRGVCLLYQLPELPDAKALENYMSSWRGVRSVASWYLWKAVDRGVFKDEKS